jgi:hypothetical protein
MKKTFLIETCSDLNYEGMVVDITFDNQRIAMINYDKGIDNLEIEILPSEDEPSECVFPLKDFLEILEKAKEITIQCAKEDEERKNE